MLTAAYSATDGGTVTQRVTYAYDAFGVRISRQAWDGTTTTTERYGIDPADPAKPAPIGTENSDVWAVLDGSNALVSRWMFGPEPAEVLARQTALGTVSWDLTDRQGSVRLVIDNSATTLGSATFDGYGNLVAGTVYDGFGYTGQRFDPVTLYYSNGNGTREYDPAAGLFYQRDPIWDRTGEPNPYMYVRNSPTNATDPSGNVLIIPESQKDIWDSIASEVSRTTGQKIEFGYTQHPDGLQVSIPPAARVDKVHNAIVNELYLLGLDTRTTASAIWELYSGGLAAADPNHNSAQLLTINRNVGLIPFQKGKNFELPPGWEYLTLKDGAFAIVNKQMGVVLPVIEVETPGGKGYAGVVAGGSLSLPVKLLTQQAQAKKLAELKELWKQLRELDRATADPPPLSLNERIATGQNMQSCLKPAPPSRGSGYDLRRFVIESRIAELERELSGEPPPAKPASPSNAPPSNEPGFWFYAGHGLGIAVGVLEGAGATALALTPEPTFFTKAAAWGLAFHAADTIQSHGRSIAQGKDVTSVTAQVGEGLAKNLLGYNTHDAKMAGHNFDFSVSLLSGGYLTLVQRARAGATIVAVAKPKTVVTPSSAQYFPGINAATTDDLFIRYAGRVKTKEGYFDLYTHAYNAGKDFGKLNPTSGIPEAADLLDVAAALQRAGWKPGQPIRLISCRVGDASLGSQAAAQKLADLLKVEVLAPSERIWLYSNGKYVHTMSKPTSSAAADTGTWYRFRPGQPPVKAE